MATQAQIIANRKNCQKSTGPKTRQGKAIVAQNAVKHGLAAAQAVITTEDQVEYDLYREQFLAELAPQTPMESMLAERIVDLSWRLKRITRFQNQTINAMNTPDPKNPFAKMTESMMKRYGLQTSASSKKSSDFPLGRLAIKDFSNSRVLERLLMYERRLEHSLYKTIVELQRLNLIKNLHPKPEMTFKQLNNFAANL